jgi:hypothetical protein
LATSPVVCAWAGDHGPATRHSQAAAKHAQRRLREAYRSTGERLLMNDLEWDVVFVVAALPRGKPGAEALMR